jgi:hypothetical protein
VVVEVEHVSLDHRMMYLYMTVVIVLVAHYNNTLLRLRLAVVVFPRGNTRSTIYNDNSNNNSTPAYLLKVKHVGPDDVLILLYIPVVIILVALQRNHSTVWAHVVAVEVTSMR